MKDKKFEIFSGTGGVGKSTLATARAIDLAKQGRSVLLITIDPAKRLRELLNISLNDSGQVIHVPDPLNDKSELNLHVELMDPTMTFERIAHDSGHPEVLNNRILKILTKPYGGLNEILAIVELNLQIKKGIFDVIVLDTPPGSHFLDFLDSVDRIKLFFDQSFVDIFQYLGKKVERSAPGNLGKRVMNFVVSKGVKKLLNYLNKVTGDKFVDDFIEAIIAIYKTQSSFLDALSLQDKLKNPGQANWYLVTSVEQNKLQEALEIKESAKGLITKDSFMILNKCLEQSLISWEPDKDSKDFLLKDSLITRENKLKENLNRYFNQVLEFPEVFDISPLEHVKELTNTWERFRQSGDINGKL